MDSLEQAAKAEVLIAYPNAILNKTYTPETEFEGFVITAMVGGIPMTLAHGARKYIGTAWQRASMPQNFRTGLKVTYDPKYGYSVIHTPDNGDESVILRVLKHKDAINVMDRLALASVDWTQKHNKETHKGMNLAIKAATSDGVVTTAKL